MYIPASFRVEDRATLHRFVADHSFATLVTHDDMGGMTASHLPLLLDTTTGEHGTIEGHWARANPQSRQLTGEALAIFAGPHAYVSPSWYEAERVVPTWNYVAVHAYGQLEPIDDEAEVLSLLRRSLAKYESAMPAPWTLEQAGDAVANMLSGIVAFRMPVTRLEGKWKLSQNHTAQRQARVAAALEANGGEDNQAIAALMRAKL